MPGETHDANYLICKFLIWAYMEGGAHVGFFAKGQHVNFFKLRFGKVADFKLLFLHGEGINPKKENMRTTFYDGKTQGIPTLY